MCGIAGYVSNADIRGFDRILEMTRVLAQRGPDDEGLALISRGGQILHLATDQTAEGIRLKRAIEAGDEAHAIALGHRRFSIIDLSKNGHQPFASQDGRVVVAFNGEVYNYIELRNELASIGHDFRTSSDTEVLVEAYRAWGQDFLKRLSGFFAIALYDARRAELLLARDRMGKAPLYLRSTATALFFGSEIRSVLPVSERRDARINETALIDFVHLGLRDWGNETLYTDVHSFPAASLAWLAPGSLRLEPIRYWRLPRQRLRSDEISSVEAVNECRSRLSEAVRIRLRADVPIGFELSGGLDSSAIVAFAVEHGAHVHAYTASFPGSDVDEEPFAHAVADRYPQAIDYRVIAPPDDDLIKNLDSFVAHIDEPFHAPNLYTNTRIWREMAREGIRVTLNGAAGDEVLAGYGHEYFEGFLYQLARTGRLREAISESVAWSEAPLGAGYPAAVKRVIEAVLAHFPGSGTLQRARRALYQRRLLGPGLLGYRRARSRVNESLSEQVLEDLSDWKMNYWMRAANQSYMSVPIELRAPFLDHHVVELGATLPLEFLIHHGWHKWILRKVVEPALPEAVVWRRRKAGFPFPLGSWLYMHRDRFLEVSRAPDPPWLEHRELRLRYDRLAQRAPGLLWRLLSVALWWKRCVLGIPLGGERTALAY